MAEREPKYNLKAVIHETGLNPETLRAWERRYGLIKPQRTPGGHRLYSDRDVKMLKWLVARRQEGLSISRAVELWRSLENNGRDPLASRPSGRTVTISGSVTLQELRRAWIEACQDFDEVNAVHIMNQALAIASPEAVCIEVLLKGMSEVGQKWYEGEFSVQQEHFTSALAMRRLHTLASAAPFPSRPGRLLAACPPGEEHEFGLLMATFLLRRQGWDVKYLGANVPLLRLEDTLRSIHPDLVISLAQTLPGAASLRDMSLFLRKHGTHVAYGGGIFSSQPLLTARIPGFYLGENFAEIQITVEQILNREMQLPSYQNVSPEYHRISNRFMEQRPLIEGTVADRMKESDISPAHLEQASTSLSQYFHAALALGDISLLECDFKWVEGLLSNQGLPPQLLRHYLRVFSSAVEEHLGEDAQAILDWIVKWVG